MAESHHASRNARLEEVRALAAFMVSRCEAAGLSADIIAELELALVEAANNIVIHGYEGREDGDIGLTVRIDAERVELELTDRGLPVAADALQPRPVAPDAESGRGMAIIHACVDHVGYHRANGINHLVLIKRINPSADGG
ncbi:ATP-binding protein [Rhizorhabdus histidinilytica]|uniref:Serine/threonine-protein kinase RsbW n=1 Tax=Rhizorhabdus histidinilytica TaxID=439228 RepID=A0A1T5D1S9_9SPHN|nr:ATP-binding protein [Rhizorhabdus histidinilytica]SKB65587.1 serine/threonine-protein kinase RsbW [Rhizorhabdus histidinilytica]